MMTSDDNFLSALGDQWKGLNLKMSKIFALLLVFSIHTSISGITITKNMSNLNKDYDYEDEIESDAGNKILGSVRDLYCNQEYEEAINKLIWNEQYASYVFRKFALFYESPEVGLRGFEWLFWTTGNTRYGIVGTLQKFLNKIGCLIHYKSIPKPKEDARDHLHNMEATLTILNSLYKDNKYLNSLAIRLGQLRLADFLDKYFDAMLYKLVEIRYYLTYLRIDSSPTRVTLLNEKLIKEYRFDDEDKDEEDD